MDILKSLKLESVNPGAYAGAGARRSVPAPKRGERAPGVRFDVG